MTNPDNVGGLPSQHGMARRLELAADRIAERAPEENARLFRDAAQCIQTLFNVKEALQGELCRAAPAGGDEPDVLHPQYRHGFESGMKFEGEHGLMTTNAPKRDSAPAGSGEVGRTLADDIVKAVCDELRIGEQSRSKSVILTNVRNVIRRADCLGEVEREFFTENGFDDDGDEYAECPLPWGADADEYAKQFAAAWNRRASAGREAVAWGVMYPSDHPQAGQIWTTFVDRASAVEGKDSCWNAGDDLIVPLYTRPTAPELPKQGEGGGKSVGGPLAADFVRALPNGMMDDATFQQIEDALDRAGAPITGEDGRWLTLSQRIRALAKKAEGV